MAANSTSAYIAHDLVDEILLRLPLKSIIRFKSVSRQWKSSIESQSFIERHQKNSSRKILLASDSGCIDRSSPPYILPDEEGGEEICYIHNCDASSISLTCDGLICIPRSDSIDVCNPASRESRRFPISEPLVWTSMPHIGTGSVPVISILHSKKLEDWELNVAKFPLTTRSSFGFGKDEVTGVYKVVELNAPNGSFLVGNCNVLDLKTGRWRHVSLVPYRIFFTERSVYVNGSVHWFTVDIWEPKASKIVAFDLHVEKFRVVSHPNQSLSSDVNYPHLSELLSLRNRLSVSEMRAIPDVQLNVWSMVDIEEERWVHMHYICLCKLYQPLSSSVQLFTPLVISEGGHGGVIIWDYRGTLFKSDSFRFHLQDQVYTNASVVASSYIQTLVRVW